MAKYTVEDTREISTLTQTGNEKKYYRVWLRTGNGAGGTVDVSQADWNKERLAEILAAKAEELDLAFTLAG